MWRFIASLGDHFGVIGAAIICLFAGSWIASALCYRLLGYHISNWTPRGSVELALSDGSD
jgi:hypothetical protein